MLESGHWDDQFRLARELQGHCADAHTFAFRVLAGSVRTSSRQVLSHDGQVEDIVLRVFEELWEHPERFDPARGTLAAFLRVQARARSIDLVRSEIRRVRRERASWLHHLPPFAQDPIDDVVVTDTTDELRHSVSQLPESERVAIELSYFGGKSYRAVAAQLGLPEGTVKARIRRGLLRLRTSALAGTIRVGSLDDSGAL